MGRAGRPLHRPHRGRRQPARRSSSSSGSADVLWEELARRRRPRAMRSSRRSRSTRATTRWPSILEDIAASRDGGWTALVDAVAAEDAPRPRTTPRRRSWPSASCAGRAGRHERPRDGGPLPRARCARSTRRIPSCTSGSRARTPTWATGTRSASRSSAPSPAPTGTRGPARHPRRARGALRGAHLGTQRHAAEHYEQALAIDAALTMRRWRGSSASAARTSSTRACAEILDRQVDAAESDEERVGVLVRLGGAHRAALRASRARPCRSTSSPWSSTPRTPRALDGLERCWHALRDWDKLATALERRAVARRRPARRHRDARAPRRGARVQAGGASSGARSRGAASTSSTRRT